jgi:hypothetical protein
MVLQLLCSGCAGGLGGANTSTKHALPVLAHRYKQSKVLVIKPRMCIHTGYRQHLLAGTQQFPTWLSAVAAALGLPAASAVPSSSLPRVIA